MDPVEPAPARYRERLYTPEHTDRTYTALTQRAGDLLAHGESVVLDASWTRARHRDAARQVAVHSHSDLAQLRCEAPREIAARRIRQRTGSMSDADEQIAAALAADADSWPEAATIDTTVRPDQAIRDATDAARAAAWDARMPATS